MNAWNEEMIARATLPPIPVVDVADPARRLIEGAERMRGLRDACLTCLPGAIRLMLPVMDIAARRWLTKSCSR